MDIANGAYEIYWRTVWSFCELRGIDPPHYEPWAILHPAYRLAWEAAAQQVEFLSRQGDQGQIGTERRLRVAAEGRMVRAERKLSAANQQLKIIWDVQHAEMFKLQNEVAELRKINSAILRSPARVNRYGGVKSLGFALRAIVQSDVYAQRSEIETETSIATDDDEEARQLAAVMAAHFDQYPQRDFGNNPVTDTHPWRR